MVQDKSNIDNETQTNIPSLISCSVHVAFVPSLFTDKKYPVHLYQILGSTKLGCEILLKEGSLEYYKEKCRRLDVSSLWLIGNLLSSTYGDELIERNIVDLICETSLNHTDLSLRGVCYYIVNLMCHNKQIKAYILNSGWTAISEESLPIVIPKDLRNFYLIKNIDENTVNIEEPLKLYAVPQLRFDDYLKLCSGLGIQLCQKKCMNSLTRFKKDNNELFSSSGINIQQHVDALITTFEFISDHNLNLSNRKFVLGLFDQNIYSKYFK